MATKKFKVEEGLRVQVTNGFYDGHQGEVMNKIGDQWRVRLDQAHKLALVDEADISAIPDSAGAVEEDAPANDEGRG